MIKSIEDFLDIHFNNIEVFFISIVVLFFSLFRLPSVSEPYWYGDEGIYEVVGSAIRNGRILYSQIWDNKPPILYLIYALFNGDQFYSKLASLIVGLLSVLVFFVIAKKIFSNIYSIFISTAFFALMFGLPIIEGNIANAENFMVLPTLIAFYLLFVNRNKNSFLNISLAGVLLSLAFLTKIVAIFDLAAFSVATFGMRFFDKITFTKKDVVIEVKNLFKTFQQETVLLIAFIIPIILTSLYFFLNSAILDFFRATFSQNVGYVGYGNFFLFPMGLIFLKLFLLVIATLITFRFRKSLGKLGFVIFIWFFFSVFDAFFSARPYTHYLLVVLPAASLVLGYMIESKKHLMFTIPLILIILFFINHNFKFYTKIIPYYQNYFSFVTGGKNLVSYQTFFDHNTPRDYDIARFINLNTIKSQGIFLWSDSAQIYALTGKLPPGRYAVAYHITFYKNAVEETKKAIAQKNPRYIIQTKEGPEIASFLDGYDLRYKFSNSTIYERQF